MTSRSDLKPGDVVCLSGTPMKMLVAGAHEDGESFTRCKWYDVEGNINEYPFQTALLVRKPGNTGGRFPGRR